MNRSKRNMSSRERLCRILMISSSVLVAVWIVELISAYDHISLWSGILGIISNAFLIVSMALSIKSIRKNMIQDIYFAGGCFWGTEKYFKLIKGVVGTEVGYANGNTEKPTYEQVYTDTTGYAECVHVRFDTEQTTVRKLAELYFKAIDPTSLNQQGEDKGTRYRTGVYYVDPERQGVGSILKQVFEEQSRIYGKLAVELMPLKNFVPAEEYHQDYLDKNPGGYCHLSPELFEFAKKQG